MELETSSAQTVSDLKGTTIGVIKGNPAGSDFVDLLNKTYPNKFQIKAYENVSDIVNGNLLAMFNNYCGTIDLCTGVSISLNEVAKYFNCPVKYMAERPGDIKHIIQSPDEAYNILGWKALVELKDGMADVL